MAANNVHDKIVNVAFRLFYEQGYNRTGINQIIEEAGIAKASLYNHFSSKTDLLLAYLHRFNDQWFSGADKLLGTFSDPKQKLLAIFDYRINNQRKSGYGGCAFIKISAELDNSEPEVTKLVAANKERLRTYIHKLVLQANESHILSNEALTDLIFLLMEGGLSSAPIFRNTKDLESAKKIVKKLL